MPSLYVYISYLKPFSPSLFLIIYGSTNISLIVFIHVQSKNEKGDVQGGMDAADTLNVYYATVEEKLASKIQTVRNNIHNSQNRMPVPMHNQMVFRFVNTVALTSLIKSLKNGRPSGIQNIRTSALKNAHRILIVEFTFLINVCLDKSVLPSTWKKGTITPIPKMTLCTSPSDYRPISVLLAPSKVLERAVYNQIVYYLEINGLLDRRQHGFRKDHSTSSAIFDVTQYL